MHAAAAKSLEPSRPRVKFQRAQAITLDADARARGVSRGAAELLAVLREERARRAVVVPSLERLACLVARGGKRPPHESTIRRQLNELSRAGLLWRAYRGGRGMRSVYYLAPPRELPAGFRLVGGAPLSTAAAVLDPLSGYPRISAGVTAPCSLSGNGEIGQTEGAPAELVGVEPCETSTAAAARPEDEPHPPAPAPRAGEPRAATAAPQTSGEGLPRAWLAMVWAVWRAVVRARSGRAYRVDPRDGPVSLALARRYGGRAGGDRQLAWRFATYLRSPAARRSGGALWLCPVDDVAAERRRVEDERRQRAPLAPVSEILATAGKALSRAERGANEPEDQRARLYPLPADNGTRLQGRPMFERRVEVRLDDEQRAAGAARAAALLALLDGGTP